MIKFLKKLILSALLTSAVGLTSCKEAEMAETPQAVAPEKELVVSAEKLTTVPAEGLRQLATSIGRKQLNSLIKYDVDVYRLTYLTQYQGKEVKATGLMLIPLNVPEAMPVLSAHHGTTFDQESAPSHFNINSLSGYEAFGAAGYLTLIPDYLGYGASKQIFHPYYDAKYSGLAVVDMIKAAKSYYKKNKINASDKLFLAGYSEGGYVTLAAQKEIEEHPEHGLKVTASAAGAGGYDLPGMLGRVISGKPYDYPANLAFILQAYNVTNNWNRPLTDFYQEPYATRLQELLDGTRSSGAINSQLAKDPAKFFKPDFLAALKSDGEQDLKQALQKNNLAAWVPKSPTRLYHGNADTMVPYENTQSTYKAMIDAGAKDLKFITVPGGTHFSSLEPMIQDLVPWFESL